MDVKLLHGSKGKIVTSTIPVVNGQVIFATDSNEIWYDLDDVRRKATDYLEVDSLPLSGQSDKLYFHKPDGQLYRWESLTSKFEPVKLTQDMPKIDVDADVFYTLYKDGDIADGVYTFEESGYSFENFIQDNPQVFEDVDMTSKYVGFAKLTNAIIIITSEQNIIKGVKLDENGAVIANYTSQSNLSDVARGPAGLAPIDASNVVMNGVDDNGTDIGGYGLTDGSLVKSPDTVIDTGTTSTQFVAHMFPKHLPMYSGKYPQLGDATQTPANGVVGVPATKCETSIELYKDGDLTLSDKFVVYPNLWVALEGKCIFVNLETNDFLCPDLSGSGNLPFFDTNIAVGTGTILPDESWIVKHSDNHATAVIVVKTAAQKKMHQYKITSSGVTLLNSVTITNTYPIKWGYSNSSEMGCMVGTNGNSLYFITATKIESLATTSTFKHFFGKNSAGIYGIAQSATSSRVVYGDASGSLKVVNVSNFYQDYNNIIGGVVNDKILLLMSKTDDTHKLVELVISGTNAAFVELADVKGEMNLDACHILTAVPGTQDVAIVDVKLDGNTQYIIVNGINTSDASYIAHIESKYLGDKFACLVDANSLLFKSSNYITKLTSKSKEVTKIVVNGEIVN